ncbi:MAG TPA: hypothetical protein VN799_10880 [Acidimicrobiales bacterium]|nr:hypothetical protein [Acidimicrobiales bacterium]
MKVSTWVLPIVRPGAVPIAAAALFLLVTPGVGHADSLPTAPGCTVLPADNVWHADVSSLPVDPNSAT